jgi:hypothetical protein
MTEEVNEDINNFNISIEQILAAILNKLGSVELSPEELLDNYSSKSIAVDQDPDSKIIRFELAETPQTENE